MIVKCWELLENEMKHQIKLEYLYEDNGDCELGCWNDGEGYRLTIDGVVVSEVDAWATCTSNSEHDQNEIFEALLKHFNIEADVTIL